MRTLAIVLAIMGGLTAAPVLADEDNTVHADGSTSASYTRIPAKPSGPDHAHMWDQRKCQEMGFKLGTDAFANCQVQLKTIRAGRRAAETSAQVARDAAYMQAKAVKD